MEDLYTQAKQAFDEKDFILALELFSKLDYLDSKIYENKCIDNLEDLIYYEKRKKAIEYLKKLEFYQDYSLFVDAYKRRKLNILSKALMFGSAIIGTIVFLVLMFL